MLGTGTPAGAAWRSTRAFHCASPRVARVIGVLFATNSGRVGKVTERGLFLDKKRGAGRNGHRAKITSREEHKRDGDRIALALFGARGVFGQFRIRDKYGASNETGRDMGISRERFVSSEWSRRCFLCVSMVIEALRKGLVIT